MQSYVRPCHGETIRYQEDYVKLVLPENPDKIILHIGTSNLPSGEWN